MRIDKKLNLVIPVETNTGTLYIHAIPLLRNVFEKYFLVISKTFAALYNEGLGPTAGPRIAAMMLRDVATRMNVWDGPEGVALGLMSEIRRTSQALILGDKGWETIPLQEALDKKLITDEEAGEVENILVFFTVVSAMHRKTELPAILTLASELWGAQTTSSSATEFSNSLPKSTEIPSSEPEETTLLVPQ